ncbi:MAG: hypothetical protein ACYDCT_14925 [Dehalococcoidia bacterium]
MKKLAAILAIVGLGLAGFAGTCNLLQTSLTQIGTTDTYAGALQNNTGANFLAHKFKVAFVDINGNVIDQRTNVSGCLRSWQNGTSDFFSVASIQPAASTAAAIASLDYSQPLTGGTTLATSSTVTSVAASLNSTTLTVTGTLRNNDAVTLVQPNVCAVVYNSSGTILVTQMSSLADLAISTSANFSLSIAVPGSTVSSNTVTVWADGLENNIPTTPISSVSTAVSAGANRLAFTTQPSATGSTGGIAFASQPVVTLYDQFNNVLTSSSASVTLTLSGGTAGAALTCNQAGNTVTAFNGTAAFTGCKINLANPSPATGYVLTASSLGATGAVSNAITITVGPAAQVGFTTQPVGAAAGQALATQPVVQVQDAGGNNVGVGSNQITLSVSPGSTASGLTCTSLTVTASSGVANFAGCTLTGAGTATLLAQATGLNQGTSASFTITSLAQTITFTALSNQLLTSGTYSIAGKATASSGLPITYSSLTAATCTVSGSMVTLVATGTCTIQASQAGNATYSAAPSATQSFTIS